MKLPGQSLTCHWQLLAARHHEHALKKRASSCYPRRELWMDAAKKVFADLEKHSDGKLPAALRSMVREKIPEAEVEYAIEDALVEAGYLGNLLSSLVDIHSAGYLLTHTAKSREAGGVVSLCAPLSVATKSKFMQDGCCSACVLIAESLHAQTRRTWTLRASCGFSELKAATVWTPLRLASRTPRPTAATIYPPLPRKRCLQSRRKLEPLY